MVDEKGGEGRGILSEDRGVDWRGHDKERTDLKLTRGVDSVSGTSWQRHKRDRRATRSQAS